MTTHQAILHALNRANPDHEIRRLLAYVVNLGVPAERANDVVVRTFGGILDGLHDGSFDGMQPLFVFLATAARSTLVAMSTEKNAAGGKSADVSGSTGGDL
jgi:hypothetical protein